MSAAILNEAAMWTVAVSLLISSWQTVRSKNLVHSVLWLGVGLAMTAVLFILLHAPFIAGVQILLYAGGVITLMLFGIMLTRKHSDLQVENESSRHVTGAATALGLFGLMATAILTTNVQPTTKMLLKADAIGKSFLTDHLLAFEVLSLLLLAVMVGAIVVGRKRDAGAPAPTDFIRKVAAKR